LQPQQILYESCLESLPLSYRGKVRDVYVADTEHLLVVATDRLSAFDVVLPTGIPGKGRILTEISSFWFRFNQNIIPNHLQLAECNLHQALPDPDERALICGRSVVVRKLNMLPVEAIVRGYLFGSGWKDYCNTGKVGGVRLPPGLKLADRLPEPIYTPSTKAKSYEHDVNIDFEQTVELLGRDLAQQVRAASIRLYKASAAYALTRGIIIADSKFEFGLDRQKRLILADELLTPDSSRFWSVDHYIPGTSPPSYDKQFVRDYLEQLGWNKKAPGPVLPPMVQNETAALYQEALRKLVDV
jgi:phosphoribosylaminoimidazole-succinocarboxamide synthase